MARTPGELFARLRRCDEFVLIEPRACVLARQRRPEGEFRGVAGRRDAGTHHVDAQRPLVVAEEVDLALDCRSRLDHAEIGVGEVRDVDPRPPLLRVAAVHHVAALGHREPIGADAVVAVVAVHEAGAQDRDPGVRDRERFELERTPERERVVRVRLGTLIHDGNADFAEDRAPGGVDEPRPRSAALRKRGNRSEERTVGFSRLLLVEHGMDDQIALRENVAIGLGLTGIARRQRDLVHA